MPALALYRIKICMSAPLSSALRCPHSGQWGGDALQYISQPRLYVWNISWSKDRNWGRNFAFLESMDSFFLTDVTCRRAASSGRWLQALTGIFTTIGLCMWSAFAYLLCVLNLPVWNVSGVQQHSREPTANVSQPHTSPRRCTFGGITQSWSKSSSLTQTFCGAPHGLCSVSPVSYISYVCYRCTLTCPFDSQTGICFTFRWACDVGTKVPCGVCGIYKLHGSQRFLNCWHPFVYRKMLNVINVRLAINIINIMTFVNWHDMFLNVMTFYNAR